MPVCLAFSISSVSLIGETLSVGFTTRATLNRLFESGEVTTQKAQQFQQAALAFLIRAVEYAMDKLPLKYALLKHARFVDVQLRAECGVEDALYSVDRQGFSHTDSIFLRLMVMITKPICLSLAVFLSVLYTCAL